MDTRQIIEKTEALIDALRATCSANMSITSVTLFSMMMNGQVTVEEYK